MSQKAGRWWLGISVSHPAGHACFCSAPQGREGLVAARGRLTPPGTPRQSHSCCPSRFSRRARQSLPPGCPLGTCGAERGESLNRLYPHVFGIKGGGFAFLFCTSPRTYLSYNWKFGPFILLHPSHSLPLAPTNVLSVSMSLRFYLKKKKIFFFDCATKLAGS